MSTLTLNSMADLSQNKKLNIALWVVQVLTGGMFIMAGYSKLSGAEQMVQVFNAIGLGQWFRYLTGGIEVFSACLLFTPRFSGIGGLLLSCTMFGALLTHLLVLGGNPAMALILLAASILIAWGRKNQTLAIIGR